MRHRPTDLMHSLVVLSESKGPAILVLNRTAATSALPSPAAETATNCLRNTFVYKVSETSTLSCTALYKAGSAGRQLVRVHPRGTSQRGPCAKPAPKKLADRQHVCTRGLRTTRDHASSLEILRLGLSLQPLTAVP